MTDRTFHILSSGFNCEAQAAASIASVLAQTGVKSRLVVVDDASTDGTWDAAQEAANAKRRNGQAAPLLIRHDSNVGAMASQWEAWHAAEPKDGDVICWVDLDDALATPKALQRVAREYDAGALLTYGSYSPRPASRTCPPARPYPPQVGERRAFRQWIREGRGIHHNHFRSCSWEILRQIPEEYLRDDSGEWWSTGPDMAVCLPALELAGPRYAFIPDVLYYYASSLPSAEWRSKAALVRANHTQMLARPPVVPVQPLESRDEHRAALRAQRVARSRAQREARAARMRERRTRRGM